MSRYAPIFSFLMLSNFCVRANAAINFSFCKQALFVMHALKQTHKATERYREFTPQERLELVRRKLFWILSHVQEEEISRIYRKWNALDTELDWIGDRVRSEAGARASDREYVNRIVQERLSTLLAIEPDEELAPLRAYGFRTDFSAQALCNGATTLHFARNLAVYMRKFHEGFIYFGEPPHHRPNNQGNPRYIHAAALWAHEQIEPVIQDRGDLSPIARPPEIQAQDPDAALLANAIFGVPQETLVDQLGKPLRYHGDPSQAPAFKTRIRRLLNKSQSLPEGYRDLLRNYLKFMDRYDLPEIEAARFVIDNLERDYPN